jgi:RimJ/RimL family protein N-acetyltransferase
VVAYAFRPVVDGGLGLTRLHAATDRDNYVSQSILQSAWFTQWGADHQAWRRADGSLSDGTYFELLASDLVAPEVPAGPNRRAIRAGALESVTLESDPLQSGGAPKIRLREWRRTDAERVAEACSDERTRHWLAAASLPSPYTVEHAHSYIARCIDSARAGSSLNWCVADHVSDLCLGSVAVMDLRHALGTAGEVGYWAHPEARGLGVMSEAVRLAMRHAFIPREDGGLGRKRLRLNAADGNSASLHIARVNGFVPIGRDRQSEPLGDGTFADLMRFDLLLDEWERSL